MNHWLNFLKDRSFTAQLRELRLMREQPAYRFVLNWLLVAAKVVGPIVVLIQIAHRLEIHF